MISDEALSSAGKHLRGLIDDFRSAQTPVTASSVMQYAAHVKTITDVMDVSGEEPPDLTNISSALDIILESLESMSAEGKKGGNGGQRTDYN